MLPVVARELSVTARRTGPYRARVIAALIGLVTMFWMLAMATFGGTAQQGQSIFNTLSGIAFVYCLLAGVGATADCISAEKRGGTLGLLFLTDLKGYDVALGKLVSSSITAVYAMLAVVPVLALGLLLGGVSLGQVARMALVLANTMFFSLAVGLFVSSISQNERKVMFATLVVVLGITSLPMIVVGFVQEVLEKQIGEDLIGRILLTSPVMTMVATYPGVLPRMAWWWFYASLGWIHGLAWLFLLGAIRVLPDVWRDRPRIVTSRGFVERLHRWRRGDPVKNHAFRRGMLDANAFAWLASRDRFKPHMVWGALGAIVVLWAGSMWHFSDVLIREADSTVYVLFIVHGFLKLWLASEVSTRLIEDRRSGALELILVTPLAPAEIARGQWLALRRQFFRPVLAVLALDVGVLLFALRTGGATLGTHLAALCAAMALLLLLDLWTLHWVAMWRALTAKNLNRALVGSLFLVLGIPWVGWTCYGSGVALLKFLVQEEFPLTLGTFVGVWTGLGVMVDLLVALPVRRRFLAEFRERAAARFDLPAQATAATRRSWRQWLREAHADSARGYGSIFRRYRLVWACVALVLVFVAGVKWRQWHYARALARETAAIRQRGEPVTLAEIARLRPPIPAASNALDRLLAIAPRLSPLYSGGFTQNASNNISALDRRTPLPPATRAHLEKLAAVNASILAAVREAAAMRGGQFPMSSPLFGPTQFLHRLIQVLEAEGVLRVDDGDTELALRTIHTLLGLGRLLLHDANPDVVWWRSSAINAALNTLERVLSHGPISEAELLKLERTLLALDAATLQPERLVQTMRILRAHQLELHDLSLAELLASTGAFPAGSPIPSSMQTAFILAKLTGEWDRHWVGHLRWFEAAIVAVGQPFPQSLQRLQSLERAVPNASSGISRLSPWFGNLFANPGHHWLVQTDANLQTRLRAAQTALALERWRAHATGSGLPDHLDRLVPTFLEQLPKDPTTGQPMHYTRFADGYSVSSQTPGASSNLPRKRRSRSAQDVTFEIER